MHTQSRFDEEPSAVDEARWSDNRCTVWVQFIVWRICNALIFFYFSVWSQRHSFFFLFLSLFTGNPQHNAIAFAWNIMRHRFNNEILCTSHFVSTINSNLHGINRNEHFDGRFSFFLQNCMFHLCCLQHSNSRSFVHSSVLVFWLLCANLQFNYAYS